MKAIDTLTQRAESQTAACERALRHTTSLELPALAVPTADIAVLFQKENVRAALSILGMGMGELSEPVEKNKSIMDPAVAKAVQAVRDRKPDEEIDAFVRPLTESQIRAASAEAEANSGRFDAAGEKVEQGLQAVDKVVQDRLARARAVHQNTFRLGGVIDDLASPPSNDSELIQSLMALRRTDATLQRHLATLEDYHAARTDYTARRVDREAAYNLEAAWPYELRVHRSAVDADRHRLRSQWFFFAMLGAQAATAIASLALAAKFKSVLWSLAGVAGLVALSFAAYVYVWV